MNLKQSLKGKKRVNKNVLCCFLLLLPFSLIRFHFLPLSYKKLLLVFLLCFFSFCIFFSFFFHFFSVSPVKLFDFKIIVKIWFDSLLNKISGNPPKKKLSPTFKNLIVSKGHVIFVRSIFEVLEGVFKERKNKEGGKFQNFYFFFLSSLPFISSFSSFFLFLWYPFLIASSFHFFHSSFVTSS